MSEQDLNKKMLRVTVKTESGDEYDLLLDKWLLRTEDHRDSLPSISLRLSNDRGDYQLTDYYVILQNATDRDPRVTPTSVTLYRSADQSPSREAFDLRAARLDPDTWTKTVRSISTLLSFRFSPPSSSI